MTAEQMVARLKDRTHHVDNTKVVGELNSAKDWAFSRLFNTEHGPDQMMTFATEIPLLAYTREFDLGANVSGATIYGIKTLWVKLGTESNFTPMCVLDAGDSSFIGSDPYPATDTTTVARGHPVYYDIVNFAMLRFAPPLPAGATLRLDFWRKPPDIDPATNDTLVYSDDIPEPLHEAIVDKATAQLFTGLDDTREGIWEARAERKLSDGLDVILRRTQAPTRTTPYRRRVRSPI